VSGWHSDTLAQRCGLALLVWHSTAAGTLLLLASLRCHPLVLPGLLFRRVLVVSNYADRLFATWCSPWLRRFCLRSMVLNLLCVAGTPV
jgi:hypothetical protein